MNWVTAVWAMLIGACAALALPNLLVSVWQPRQGRGAHLFFVLATAGVIGIAACELSMMWAKSVEQFARAQQWTHLPIFVLVASLVGFIALYFGTARLWLGLAVIAVRFVALVINFASPPSLNFRQFTALRHVTFLGQRVAVPVGVASPWTRLGELSSLLLLVFVVDASIRLWKKGRAEDRRRALVVGGGTTFFILLAAGTTALIHRQVIEVPYLVSFPFAAILVAMAFELGSDLFRAAQVALKLQRSEASLHQSEEELHEIKERVALAAEAAQVGTWQLDTATNEVWVSDKVCELFQLEPGERVSYADFQKRVHPEDRAMREAAIQKAIETRGGYDIEFRVLLPDGTLRWLAGRARCVSDGDGNLTQLLGVSMDVTKRKEAEDLFRLATEASPSGTLLMDNQGRIVLVNRHIEELFGYAHDELMGQAVDILLPERFAAHHPDGFLAMPEARATSTGRELFARRKDGSEFPVEIGLSPITTPRGILVLATVVDISARKAAEEETRHRREQIDLLSRAGLLGEMTASLAHELNQPLSAIVNNATAAMQYIERGRLDPEQLRDILTDVVNDAGRAYDIVHNVRSAIKKGSAIRARINLNDVVQTVSHLVLPDAAAHSCKVDLSLTKNLPMVQGDPTQIQQVLINLVRNAFDAMLETTPARRAVQISTSYNGQETICVGVRDYGTGISEATKERLFEQFFTTKAEGLGMGLAIVRSIIEAHDGRIGVENADGGGARFYFNLPISKDSGE